MSEFMEKTISERANEALLRFQASSGDPIKNMRKIIAELILLMQEMDERTRHVQR